MGAGNGSRLAFARGNCKIAAMKPAPNVAGAPGEGARDDLLEQPSYGRRYRYVPAKLSHIALRTSLLYALVAAVWILVSDKVLVALVHDPAMIEEISVCKGWAFVAVTALLLFGALRGQLRRWEQEAAARRFAEAYLAEAQRISHTGSVGWNVATDEHVWSDETFRIFEYDSTSKVTRPLILARVHPEDRPLVQETLDRAAREAGDLDFEHRLLMPDNSVKHLHVVAHAVRREAGKVEFIGAVMDVTRQKRAEAAQSRLNRELRAVTNCNQALLRAVDEQTLLNEICRIVCQEAGYRAAWVGYAEQDEAKSVRPIAWTGTEEGTLANLGITWADTERGRGAIAAAIRTGKTSCIDDYATDPRVAPWRESALQQGFRSIIALPLKDEHANTFGSLNIYSAQPSAFTSEEIRLLEELAGDLAFGIVTLRSQAARKRAEEALRESETRFRTFVDHAADALFIYDFDQGTIVDVNRQACEGLGYMRDELIGTTAAAIHLDSEQAHMESVARRVAAGESVFDTHWHRRKDGTLFPVEAHTSQYSYGGRRFLLKVARDITERKSAEEALRRSEDYLVEGQRLAHTGSFALNVATGEHVWSEETFRIFGYDASTKITTPLVLERVHPEDRNLVRESLERAVREAGDFDYEHRLLLPDGSVKHLHIAARCVRREPGCVEYVGAVMDVTAQKSQQQTVERAFQEMEALKNQFRLAIDTIPGLVWSALPNGSTEFLNQRWLDYTGLSLKGGLDWTVATHPEDRARLVKEWETALRDGKPLETEGRLRRADGEYRWFLIRAMPLCDETGKIVKWYGKSADIEDRKKAEAQLRESEQQYRRIVDTASEGIFVCDERYMTTFVNRRMAELLGYEPEDMPGRKTSDYLFEQDVAAFEERIAARREGITERYEQRVRRKDGHPLWVHISATPVFDEERHFQGSFCMLSDITQRKMAEEELRKHRDHLEDLVKQRTEELALLNQLVYGSLASTDVGAWWIDFKEKDTYHALDNTVQMLGNTPEKTGENTYRLSQWAKSLADTKAAFPEHASVVDETMERFSGAISGKYKNYGAIYPVAGRDGSVKWFNARADVPSRDEQGRALLMTGTLIDITKLKQVEGELVEAKERAESANRAKSIFLASMSHELRTPLNVVLGFSRLMKNDQGVPANQKENLDIIVKSGEHLLNLINNVLDISKIESGRVVLEKSEADLYQLLHELQSVMGVRAAEKGLSFTLEQSPTLPRHVALDAGKLRQVLINLIGNATKYTEHGGLKLRANVVSWESPQRARLRFEVEDSGPGIGEEDRQRIFFPFVQLGNRAPAEAGTGLGLAISKQYVELMGGQIGVASEPGKGSVFHFEIPVAVLPAAEIPAKLGRGRVIGLAAGQTRFRLLIAEDQRENRLLLRKLFEPLGFELREAVNGQEAVTLFEEWHPDLIWMDIRMPVMDGLEAARHIKAAEAGSHTKIIALTAHALEEESKPILAAGCDDLVRKPYREQELFEVMARHLNLKYLYEEAGSQLSPVGSKPTIRPEQWAALPLELLTQLHQAAVELDTTHTVALIERVTELDASIGSVLNDLATKLDYPHLLRLLESEIKARQIL